MGLRFLFGSLSEVSRESWSESGRTAMPSTDALGEVGQVDDCVLQLVGFFIFGRHRDAPCTERHARIAQSFGIIRKHASDRCDVGPARGEFGVLDRVDSLGEGDHEPIEIFGQFGNVFLGRSNRWLVFEHRAGVIGWCPTKLESHTVSVAD
jgi:hypothetical protein